MSYPRSLTIKITIYVTPKKTTLRRISFLNPSSSWAFLMRIVASKASPVLAIPNAGVKKKNARSELHCSKSVANKLPALPEIANANARTSVGTIIRAAIVNLTMSFVFIMMKFASINFSDVSDDDFDARRTF